MWAIGAHERRNIEVFEALEVGATRCHFVRVCCTVVCCKCCKDCGLYWLHVVRIMVDIGLCCKDCG